jgi:sortase A
MSWRRVVAGLGRALVAFGLLTLAFVAYQLWGTGLSEARSQARLVHQFDQALRASRRPANAPTAGTGPSRAAIAAAQAAPPPPPEGSAVALIKIPRIGLDKAVVQGVAEADLRKGPGHYPETPLPGQPGNAAIAGHRTTYGAPFYRLNDLAPGDPIFVTTRQGSFQYDVERSFVVSPSDVAVVGPMPGNHLTLTTCTPLYSAAQRLVVVARLVGPAAPAPPPPSSPGPPGTSVAAAGLAGDVGDWVPAAFWGAGLAAASALFWWAARRAGRRSRARKIAVYAAGALPFLVFLFVFFENVSRLVPAQY